MGNSQSGHKLTNKELKKIHKQTNFKVDELKRLAEHFFQTYSTGDMTKREFMEENLRSYGGTPELWDQVFSTLDTDGNGTIDWKEYLIALSMVTKGTNEDKLKWAFQIYDTDKNGTIDRSEMRSIILSISKSSKLIASAQETEEGEATTYRPIEFADQLFDAMDANKDGTVSVDEFVKYCTANEKMRQLLMVGLDVLPEETSRKGSAREDTQTFENQVGGHKGKASMLKTEDGKIWKPLSTNEFKFYEAVAAITPPTALHTFIPKYFGRTFIKQETENVHYIILEDLTRDFQRPCILDLKMGSQGHGDDASTTKVIQQVALAHLTTSANLGFRVCGMRVWNVRDNAYIVKDKMWGGKLKTSKMPKALTMFIDNGVKVRRELWPLFLARLQTIREWFEKQHLFRFYSSSILLIYEGDNKDGKEPPKIDVRMVDFAHTHPITDGSIDTNYLDGLNELMKLLQQQM